MEIEIEVHVIHYLVISLHTKEPAGSAYLGRTYA